MTALDRVLSWFIAPPATTAQRADGDSRAGARGGAADLPPLLTSAATLGRPGEVEPVAAALALALRRECRAKAGAVVVVGPPPPHLGDAGGGAAARRIVSRLAAHGLEARVRGRLAWVQLDPSDPQFLTVVRRVTLIAAPAVLAVTTPRTAALDEALAEQDLLVVVTADPHGPLAQLAASGLPQVPVATMPPLGRGPSRSLARAGVRPVRAVRRLIPAAPRARA